MNEASRAQVAAAAPDVSTWLSANAGSGKTRVLTDRAARLLLQEVPPERILCLTYTKAAAMEMQNRLFARLGEWAMKPEAELRGTLLEVGVDAGSLTPDLLSRARTLFARAIETPGGLKIQTIHSFCASVLRRFPLEAGVSPGFTEIDERVQGRLISDLLDEMASDPARSHAIEAVVPYLGDEDGILSLARAVAGKAEALETPLDWAGVCDAVGIDPGLTEDRVLAAALAGDERDVCDAIWPKLDPGNKQQAKLHRVLCGMPWEAMTLDALRDLEEVCLSGEKAAEPFAAKGTKIANAAVRDQIGPDVMEAFAALTERVEAARPLRIGLMTARKTHALHAFAGAFLPAYAEAKMARGWLDFDDLILRMRKLLTAPGIAQWVLFRLDGGIDHILVDEAQDTGPEQWDIVKRLAEDFAAGEGARADVRRTIFVVGDKKQSIYSFQGADPEGFDRMRDHFDERLRGIGQPFQDAELLWSFRSARPILDLVDTVCGGEMPTSVGGTLEHKAFFGEKPGRVDLWPVVPKPEKTDDLEWYDPQDLVSEDHHYSVLAAAIADRLHAMIHEERPVISVGKERRAVEAGDILILVRRRSPLFRQIIGALKRRGLPIAGVDRSELTAPLSVQDLLALLRFLATPEDDLSLACVLRSPIGGWDENALFRLAHGRRGYLWEALRDRAADRDDWAATHAMLSDLRNKADYLRPYDLLERALVRHDGRRRLSARLGPEAEDGIDAMLAQALAYERMEVPSLTGFVGWLEAGEVTVKRDLAQARGQIRVMTVHGAKGLEAPVVILPDSGEWRRRTGGTRLLREDGGPVFWATARAEAADPVRAALEAADAREQAERNRLLYVALTRAESWLIVAAAGNMPRDRTSTWYGAVEAGLQALGAVSLAVPQIEGPGLRLQSGEFPHDDAATPRAAPAAPAPLPAWALVPAAPRPRDRQPLSPSGLGGEKIVLTDAAATPMARPDALRRGRLVHLLLEHLPGLPPPSWHDAVPRIAALEDHETPEAELADIRAEAEAVLAAPHLARVFAPDTLAEVELCAVSPTLNAPVLGAIDRLIVEDDRVLAVDFKTNAEVPPTPDATPEGLLRQMGAYAEMLGAIYPGRRIETAILWSRTAELMHLPTDLVAAALARARDCVDTEPRAPS
ncbi:double-strand break repair helicase AddA [Roseibacterium sp. SDUM158017]|uniref:double-strand break repair helicase AddA n=1 Tax=Roseicyclus salinarum TaxID=3036773 RepID=UPI002414FE24|nr:double-strand break repair helicase AddA [Roseibacterium sp. SDUM158017]MDG4650273.1 double-strand break repair helicase AddA [Roseibacterium sp. SDUM158017]